MSPIKHRIWTATPLLVAYVIVVGATIGLLVNRSPKPEEAVPAMAAPGAHEAVREGEAEEPPLWLQLFRPSPPTARYLIRAALPSLPFAGSRAEKEPRNLLILWTGRAGNRPQTLFQVMLPFLRPQGQVAAEPPRPQPPVEQPPSRPAQPGPAGPGVTGQPGGTKPPEPGRGESAKGPAEAPEGQGSPPKQQPSPPGNVALNGGLPLVGIYHTHDWESYISEFPDLPAGADLARIASFDHSKRTVVTIGERLAHNLQELGVTTVHAPFTHQDRPYDYAYQSSRETARQILKTAPSVHILLDLHRDGTPGLDSTTTIDGKPVARIRCVIGARDDQPHWQQNKRFCDDLISRMEKAHPGLTLPTLTKDSRFNQDLIPGAILLEIGNATNGYDEAERAVGYLAEALVDLVRAGAYPQ